MMGLVSFRALDRSDFPLLQRWLSAPHVDAWWREPLDLRRLERKYGPRIDGIEKTHVFIFEHKDRPIGWIQCIDGQTIQIMRDKSWPNGTRLALISR